MALDKPLRASAHSLDNRHAGPLDPGGSPEADTRTMQALVHDLRAETTALRSDAARLQEENLSYRNALQSMHDESMRWFIGLASALAAGFVGFGLLLWRVNAIQSDKRGSATAHEDRKTGQTQPLAAAPLAEERQTPAFTTPHQAQVPAWQVDAAAVANADIFSPDRIIPVAMTPPPPPRLPRTEPEHQPKADDTLEMMKLVDAWMALNAPDKVLELLQPFNEVRRPSSPLPWLCLLDVYRALGDQQKYETILARITALFNVKLAPWDAQASREPPKTLADFPHIIDEILGLWQGADVVPYLKSLLRDDRNGTRHGFDLPVYRDILQLIALASDPERLTTHGKVMPQQASAILFGTC